MLRVSKVEGWLNRPPSPSRPAERGGGCVIIRSGDAGERHGAAPRQPAAAGVSGPSAGARALALQLVMIPPGARGMPHLHQDHETALYLVSGESEVWHGDGLVQRSTVRAGDFIYIPPGTPHLTVNRGRVTSIAVVARTDPAGVDRAVVLELPRHLADLLGLPVAVPG